MSGYQPASAWPAPVPQQIGAVPAEPATSGFAPPAAEVPTAYGSQPYASAHTAPAYATASLPEPYQPTGYDVTTSQTELSPLDALLGLAVESGASDVHLVAGMPPMARIDGQLRVLDGYGPIPDDTLRETLLAAVTAEQRDTFLAGNELDFAHLTPSGTSFRANYYIQTRDIAAAFRPIPEKIRTLDELGMPAVVGGFADLPRGLVLVTGPTGSGKSTTLAAIIDKANSTRDDHILTVEDPIEFRHRSRRCLVTQREVGSDTESFGMALRQALRQDPDIILVGELRDLETIQIALTAAETGHLVLGTLHTQSAAQTVDRIVDAFPLGAQEQVRTQLAATLQGVVSQTLCGRSVGTGRVVASEVMVSTSAVRALIRDNRVHQLYSTLHGGRDHGMRTLDQSLAELVQRGEITFETGLAKSANTEEFSRMCGRTTQQRGTVVPGQEW